MLSSKGSKSSQPTIVFVLGMSRSGTSALARVVSLCGAALPSGMIGGLKHNPLGFWEPRKSFVLNRAILRRHGSAWTDPTLRFQEAGVNSREKARYISKVQRFLATLPQDPLIVIKDLQITALSDIWFEAAQLCGYRTAVIIALRHPQEVIASHMKMMGPKVAPELLAADWLKYTLLAERQTRGLRRVVVDYANLLDDWKREVDRISAALNVFLTPDVDAIEDYLGDGNRHHRHSEDFPEPFGTNWMATTYGLLADAACGFPFHTDELDRVFHSYQSSERAFRTASECFARIEKSNRLATPFLTRLALEGMAFTHGRRGTWA